MERVFELMIGHEQPRQHRERRAWFSAIGKVSRVLFGTLDESTKKEMKNLISGAKVRTAILSKILVNQTEIVCREFGVLRSKAVELEKNLHALAEEQQEEKIESTFVNAIQILEQQILQYEIYVQTLTDAILFATQGSIHPQFVNPAQVQKTAGLIAKTMSDATFPIPCENGTVADLVKIADVSIMLCETQLIYYIVIPLADYREYDLYKASPLPIPQATANGTTAYAYIWPNSPYFALTRSKDSYITIQAENLNKCKKINELYICRGMDPEQILDEHAGCEIRSAAKQHIHDLALCDIRMIKLSVTFWARTSSPNT